jgi:hypothetical protein
MNPADICFIVMLCLGIAIHLCASYLVWIEYLRPRWQHFKHRHDRGQFPGKIPNDRLGLVRSILDEASRRALCLRRGTSDDYIILIAEDLFEHMPRIWARVSIKPRSIMIVLEFSMACTPEECDSVSDMGRFFAEECNAVIMRCAPAPKQYEFQSDKH